MMLLYQPVLATEQLLINTDAEELPLAQNQTAQESIKELTALIFDPTIFILKRLNQYNVKILWLFLQIIFASEIPLLFLNKIH